MDAGRNSFSGARLRSTLLVVSLSVVVSGCLMPNSAYQTLPSCDSRVTNGSLTQEAIIPLPPAVDTIRVPAGTHVVRLTSDDSAPTGVRVVVKKTRSNFGHPPSFDARKGFPHMGVEYSVDDHHLVLRKYGHHDRVQGIPIEINVDLCIDVPQGVVAIVDEKPRGDAAVDESWTQLDLRDIGQPDYETIVSSSEPIGAAVPPTDE